MWVVLATPYRSVPFEDELAARIAADADADAAVTRLYRRDTRLRLTRGEWVRGVPMRSRGFALFGSAAKGAGGLTLTLRKTDKNDADLAFFPQSHENWWQPSKLLIDPGSTGPVGEVDLIWTAPSRTAWSVLKGADRVRLVDSIDDVMRPVDVSREVFVSSLSPRIFVLPSTDRLALSVNELPAGLAGVAVGCKVELRFGDVVFARGRWYQSGTESMNAQPVLIKFVTTQGEAIEDGHMPMPLRRYLEAGATVRFRTDVEMALCPFECERYWKVDFEVPLKELVK